LSGQKLIARAFLLLLLHSWSLRVSFHKIRLPTPAINEAAAEIVPFSSPTGGGYPIALCTTTYRMSRAESDKINAW
jgi:hypothetical protein